MGVLATFLFSIWDVEWMLGFLGCMDLQSHDGFRRLAWKISRMDPASRQTIDVFSGGSQNETNSTTVEIWGGRCLTTVETSTRALES